MTRMNANDGWRCLAIAGLLLAAYEPVDAHGVPIELTFADRSLAVSNVANVYPPLVIGQFEEESDPQGPFNDPVYGPTLLWDLPGIDITGMAGTASLAIEVLPAELGGATQTLWYWDPGTRAVEPTPLGAVLDLALASGEVVRLTGASGPAAPIELAASVAGETGFHNHGLLNYTMPYSQELDFGLYGFFARFTSSAYAPSARFLLVFNLGALYEDLAPASEALWLAAMPGDHTLDGMVDASDYDAWATNYGAAPAMAQTDSDGNGDGVIDAADYTHWRDRLGSAFSLVTDGSGNGVESADRVVWAANYGATEPSMVTKIPEPTAGAIAASLALTAAMQRLVGVKSLPSSDVLTDTGRSARVDPT